MPDLLDRLIGQLDTLVAFLAISRKEAFDLIRGEWEAWVPDGSSENLPESHEIYCTLVTHSAFLLGYSYFEAFLSDLVGQVYRARPEMLPAEKQVKYSEIVQAGDLDAVLHSMIEKEVRAVFDDPVTERIRYFEKKLNLVWPARHKTDTEIACCLRNCMVHKLARADRRLAEMCSDYEEGQDIRLSVRHVHTYGLAARDVARELYEQACQRHLRRDEG